MLDLLSSSTIAVDLIEGTASTMRVQEIVRNSLAPAFLLAGIGAVMNVMMARLIWVAERIERLQCRTDETLSDTEMRDLMLLCRRRVLAQRAVMFSTAAALSVCVVIALLFVSTIIGPQTGTIAAIAWITTMVFLITGLIHFAMETIVAARGQPRHGLTDDL